MASSIHVKIAKGTVGVDAWFEALVDDGRWTVAYRVFVPPDLNPRLAEVRIFPAERASPKRLPGTWSGVAKRVPLNGLTGAVLKLVRLSFPTRELAGIFADNPDLLAAGLRRLAPRQRKPTASAPPRRGRKRHTDDFLAGIAAEYTEAMKVSRAPVQRIAERHDQPVERVRGWIYQARERGFLLGGRLQGKAGFGALSPLAADALRARTTGSEGAHGKRKRRIERKGE